MTCLDCGTALTVTSETVKYDAVGLAGISLRQLEVRRCRDCGEVEYVIPDIQGLHRLIAKTVVEKKAALAADEIRFLRKYLGWSGTDFAEYMGTTPETVSRWEHGKMPMSPMADRLLRTMVMVGAPKADYSLDLLKDITPKATAKPLKVGLTRKGNAWTTDKAA